MDLDLLLFALRVLSGGVLLLIFALLLFFVWRDLRHAADQTLSQRRSYGQLVALADVDGGLLETGTVYPLRAITSIGRAPTNSIVIEEAFASSEHALISLRAGQWWLEDRNSRNGTRLNEDLIPSPVIITNGDIIGIGQRRFRLVLAD